MRAIILAAGMGTRLRPLTLDTPKPLIQINNESIIERQIKLLSEIGIDEVVIVTGYLNEKFDFFKDKYGVTIIHNDKYDVYNNIYTMYLVRNYLKDSYVIEGDIYITRNFLKNDIKKSTYFSAKKYDYENEWILRVDENDRVVKIETGSEDNQYIMCGVSYWNEEDANFIINKLEKYISENNFHELFWDDIIKDNIEKLNIKIEKIDTNDVYEIDSIKDLENLNKLINENN